MTYSRRHFNKLALTSLPIAAAAISTPASLFAAAKPNSKFDGVQIGVITAYSYHNMPNDIDSLLMYMVRDDINATEMEIPVQETWAGAPPPPPRPQMAHPAGGGGPQVGQPRQRPHMTPEQMAAQKEHAEAMTKWRTTMSMSKYVELRKKFNEAGVSFYGFKIPLNLNMPDAEFDYAFIAAKTLGCNQLTLEMPDGNPALTAKLGKFGEKHKLMVGYHAHLQAKPDTWDQAMSQSEWNGINLDIGHYTAAGNHDAIAFIQKNHARITSVHLKDRKFPENGGQNMPWGQGDTPIKAALQLVKKEGYKFPCTIELEYAPPEGSDSEKEVVKCLAYAKASLA